MSMNSQALLVELDTAHLPDYPGLLVTVTIGRRALAGGLGVSGAVTVVMRLAQGSMICEACVAVLVSHLGLVETAISSQWCCVGPKRQSDLVT